MGVPVKRKAGTVDICGTPWRVYLVDERGNPEIQDLYGLCDKDAQIIYINASGTKAIRRDTLSHECLHAIWSMACLGVILDGAKAADREESFVSAASTHIRKAEESARKVRL